MDAEIIRSCVSLPAARRLAIYKGFGHGIDKPKSNRAVMTHNEEWFAKWIWGEGKMETQPD